MGKQAKNKAKAKAKSKGAAAKPEEEDKNEAEQEQVNHQSAQQLILVHDAMKTIQEHPMFSSIQTDLPLKVQQGGRQEPYDAATATKALKHGSYKASANFFWQNFTWLAAHRIPLNVGQIKQFQKHFFPALEPPQWYPFDVIVAVEPSAPAQDMPEGGWHRLSPAEPVFALLFSIEEAIKKQADDSVLSTWKRLLLTTSFHFEAVAVGEDRYWRASNLREEAAEHGLAVQLSMVQRIFDIATFKMNKESASGTQLSAKKVAALYTEQLKLASNVEKNSETWVDCTLTVYRRVLKIPACQQFLAHCDEVFLSENPWNKSINALQALVDRAQTQENIMYALFGMIDGWQCGFVDAGCWSVNRLRDSRTSYLANQMCVFPISILSIS